MYRYKKHMGHITVDRFYKIYIQQPLFYSLLVCVWYVFVWMRCLFHVQKSSKNNYIASDSERRQFISHDVCFCVHVFAYPSVSTNQCSILMETSCHKWFTLQEYFIEIITFFDRIFNLVFFALYYFFFFFFETKVTKNIARGN